MFVCRENERQEGREKTHTQKLRSTIEQPVVAIEQQDHDQQGRTLKPRLAAGVRTPIMLQLG